MHRILSSSQRLSLYMIQAIKFLSQKQVQQELGLRIIHVHDCVCLRSFFFTYTIQTVVNYIMYMYVYMQATDTAGIDNNNTVYAEIFVVF